MNYATPQEMRSSLSHVLPGHALEAAIDEYFRNITPQSWGFTDADLPKKNKAPTTAKAKSPEETYAEEMRIASDKFSAAIEDMLAGRVPQTSAEPVWQHRSGADAFNPGSDADYGEFVPKEFKPVRLPACFRCGAANGCEHSA